MNPLRDCNTEVGSQANHLTANFQQRKQRAHLQQNNIGLGLRKKDSFALMKLLHDYHLSYLSFGIYNNKQQSISIFQMIKKSQTTKSSKAFSKGKCPQPDRFFLEYQKQPTLIQFRSQINRLEDIMKQQTLKRIEGEKKMMKMLRHLQETKKSKLPSRPDISTITRLMSPSRHPQESKQIIEYSNMLTTLKQQRDEQMHRIRIKQIEYEQQINDLTMKTMDRNCLQQIQCQIANIKRNQSQMKYEISKQIVSIRDAHDDLCSRVLQMPATMHSDCNYTMGQAIKDIKDFIFNLNQTVQQQIQHRFQPVQNLFRTCIDKISTINSQANYAFSSIEQQVKIASQSIMETKSTIQQTFYGSQCRSKEDWLQSASSLDCTPEPLAVGGKRSSQTMQKLCFIEKRVDNAERRLDILYSEYLSRPFHKF